MDRALDRGGPALSEHHASEPTTGSKVFLPLVAHGDETQPLEEARALWVTRWDYSSPEDVATIVERAATAHFNIIFFQIRGNADAYYDSRFEPWAQRLSGTLGQDPGWDPLALAVEEAHQRGLELHAYMNVYPAWVGTEPPSPASPEPMFHQFNRLYGDTWVQWHEDGTPMGLNPSYLWASPGHWAVPKHVLCVAQDIVSRYAVDGLHLDNVRYAGPAYSHDPVSTALFAQEQILNPALTWGDWQRARVSDLVEQMHTQACAVREGLLLSAAVWPVYRDRWPWWTTAGGYDGYYQDSLGWLQAGQIDAICPMLYGSTLLLYEDRFESLLRDFVTQAEGQPIYAGISAGYDDFSPIARRIELARAVGAQGQAIFSSRLIEQRGFWEDFRQGPYAQQALVPGRGSGVQSP